MRFTCDYLREHFARFDGTEPKHWWAPLLSLFFIIDRNLAKWPLCWKMQKTLLQQVSPLWCILQSRRRKYQSTQSAGHFSLWRDKYHVQRAVCWKHSQRDPNWWHFSSCIACIPRVSVHRSFSNRKLRCSWYSWTCKSIWNTKTCDLVRTVH